MITESKKTIYAAKLAAGEIKQEPKVISNLETFAKEGKVRISTDYFKTIENASDLVLDKIEEFLKAKVERPLEPFGKSDKAFKNNTGLEGFMHVHLTFNMSLVYQIENGKIKVFGVYSHDSLGTGNPPSIARQKSMGTKFKNSRFFEMLR
jgi:mRNA-degrading endonuclease YafQ of YafQ-DinJ toxin-antitoxin module